MSNNPLDETLKQKIEIKNSAWRKIYERLREIELAISKGQKHGAFADALGVTRQSYSRAKNKAYRYKEKHGYFQPEIEGGNHDRIIEPT